ncbi:hypothetical protein MMC20_000886 [Loxospora ochrophaea]|nr:hypothetical protein [Loxospora ochrophaea]
MAKDPDTCPSYEESLSQIPNLIPPGSNKAPPSILAPNNIQPSLSQQLTDTRTSRINAIITTHIDPLLASQALDGLYQTTFVLVPSNIAALQLPQSPKDSSSESGEVVGFPSNDHVQLVRLHGDEYKLEFWRQPAVIKELETELKARLQARGHKLEERDRDPNAEIPAQSFPPPVSAAGSPKAKKGFFRRPSSKESTTPTPTPTSIQANPDGGGWRFDRERELDIGQMRINVGLQEVCVRAVSEMGLYETRTGKAVVVRVTIGN